MQITKRQVLSYTFMPQMLPRLQELFTGGFQYVPFFIALVYQAVRLLPPGHPYLNPQNIGRFGIRHVVAEAANHLVWSKKHIDQLILFAVILIGLALVLFQIILLGLSLFMPEVMAQATMPTSFSGFFVTPDEGQDLAHMMLDMVFGVPDFFNSCVSTPEVCLEAREGIAIEDEQGRWVLDGLGFPFPIHQGLHSMFRLYSLGLLVVAALITFYFIITVVLETAQTGTAFGKRFNKVWAPLRIVVAFGLLIPIGNVGLNSAQYIVLYAAKFGSAFATNGWTIFNETITGQSLVDKTNLISRPNAPEVGGLMQFLYVAKTCAELEAITSGYSTNKRDGVSIDAYLVKDPTANPNFMPIRNRSYNEMIEFLDGDTQAIIRFGLRDETRFAAQKGYISPICGELKIPVSDPRTPGVPPPVGPERGTEIMQRYYWFVISEMFYGVYEGNPPSVSLPGGGTHPITNYPHNYAHNVATTETVWEDDGNVPLPPAQYRTVLQDFYLNDLYAVMENPSSSGLNTADPGIGTKGALLEQIESPTWDVSEALRRKGWAAAGIWYNRVAEMNGSLSNAILSVPLPSLYPQTMEYIAYKKKQQDANVKTTERFKPELANKDDIKFEQPTDAQKARALWVSYQYWQADGHSSTSHTAVTGNAITDIINAILGTEGLYNMRRNQNVHPLAKLVGVGRSLVDASIRNIGWATIGGVAGALGNVFSSLIGQAANIGVTFLMSIAGITMTMGFVLFYVLPFLPFIYFFFAVGNWVKQIFEAMVGVPLWALSHINIEGDGLPGPSAVNGYFLIFETFLRPILMIFGLLASISIFGALVSVLNEVWDLVTANFSGFDIRSELNGSHGRTGGDLLEYMRSPIDELFFTVIYTVVAYMLAMASFKLIDQIPNNILRYMGQQVTSFGDKQEDPASGLTQTAYIGAQEGIKQIGGQYQGLLGSMTGRGG